MPAISYALTHAKSREGLRSSGSIDLPFKSLPRLEYEVEHSGGANNFETTVSASANGRRLGFTVEHNGNIDQFRFLLIAINKNRIKLILSLHVK